MLQCLLGIAKKMNKTELQALIARIVSGEKVERGEWKVLLSSLSAAECALLAEQARDVSRRTFGNGVYVRGLVEISSYCKNNCYYCGLRSSNRDARRYRLTSDEILDCCAEGDRLGFNTFVLQGGEDPVQDDSFIESLVSAIHRAYPSKAITLSVGERSEQAYAAFRAAGASRYLLRHETASPAHYSRLHPPAMDCARRQASLFTLKRLGYQVGSGMMVGSPWQTIDNLVDDILFLDRLQPQMIGIGPFIPATGTPFENEQQGSAALTLLLLSLLRLRFPKALIPATTALSTLLPDGVERGLLAGANVVMPNLTPPAVRGKYTIYNNKKVTGSESAQELHLLADRLSAIGYEIDFGRGDYPG